MVVTKLMELPVLILLEKRDVDSVDCTVWDDNGGVDRLIVVAAVVDGDGDVVFVDVNGTVIFVFVVVDGDWDDVFLVVDAVYDIRVRAPDGT